MKNLIEQNKISDSRGELFGIAALLVIMTHASSYNWGVVYLSRICGFGSVGVDIFLFLSGMGLYYSMKKCNSIRTFYVHRIKRIIPSYLIIAGVLYGIIALLNNTPLMDYFLHISTLDFWVYGQNGVSAWYVSFIILLYLIYPAIYKMLSKKNWIRDIFILFLIVIIFDSILFIYYRDVYLRYERALLRVPVFLIGTVYGKNEYEGKRYPAWRFLLYGIVFFLVKVGFSHFVNPQNDLYDVGVRISYLPATLALSEFMPYLRSYVPDNPFRKMFEKLGSVSLEIYLTHILVNELYQSLDIYQTYNTPIAYLLFVVMPSLIAVLLAQYFIKKVRVKKA